MPTGTTRPPALLPSQALRIRHLTDREVSSKALPRSPKYFAQRQAFRPTWPMRILISSRLSHFMQFFDCRQKTRPSTFGVAHPNIDVESTIMFDSVRKELTKGGSYGNKLLYKKFKFFDKTFVRKSCRRRFRNAPYGEKILLMGKSYVWA